MIITVVQQQEGRSFFTTRNKKVKITQYDINEVKDVEVKTYT